MESGCIEPGILVLDRSALRHVRFVPEKETPSSLV
jgi:hypothetical protein